MCIFTKKMNSLYFSLLGISPEVEDIKSYISYIYIFSEMNLTSFQIISYTHTYSTFLFQKKMLSLGETPILSS